MTRGGSRWWSRLWRKVTDATVAVLVGTLLAAIGSYLSSYVPGAGQSMETRIAFSVPVWALSSLAVLAVGLTVVTIAGLVGKRRALAEARAAHQGAATAEQKANDAEARAIAAEAEASRLRVEIDRRDWRAKTFAWSGVEWPLTENFWGIVLRTTAEDFIPGGRADPSLLNAAIGDPICANTRCRREVWRHASDNRCRDCGTTFQLGLTGMENVPDDAKLRLKREVYREARADYLRRQTG